MIERNLWATPALFVFVAWVLFKADTSPLMQKIAWIVYLAGWIPVLGMLGLVVAQRRNPGIGAVFGCGILLIMGVVFWANHG
ncbi:hypothetical protein OG520_14560 [Streptomyces sp. NBC_00984]|uniref:hypothetical protein n=1 Tax=Streptomyces sp. NBC_00984 TaxID=2903700 RepID=UPI00386DE66A|nr:hypothetical protein OG520_14560 [Streptomyces sp. NBC_00984]